MSDKFYEEKLSVEDRIIKSKIKIQQVNPFFSYLLMHMKFQRNDRAHTIGVDPDGNVFWNKNWMEKLSESETTTILLHETLHCVLRHCERAKTRDKDLWNRSVDCTVNQMLLQNGFKDLPKGGIIPKYDSYNFFGIEIENISKKTAEEIYDELGKAKEEQSKQKQKAKGKKKDDEDDEDGEGDGDSDYEFDEHIPDVQKENKDAKDMKDAQDKNEDSGEGKNSDSENKEEQISKNEDLDEKWGRILSEADAHARMAGKQTLGIDRYIEKLLNPKMNWKSILQREIIHESMEDYTWSVPSRRSHEYGIYLPSQKKENINLAIAIDSSGCFRGDTLIYTEDGIKEIKELKENDRIINSDFEENKIDIIKKKFCFSSNELIKIKTKSGKEIICTPNHKIFIFKNVRKMRMSNDKRWLIYGTEEGKIIEKRADEIQKNDIVLTTMKINYPQNEIKLPIIKYNEKYRTSHLLIPKHINRQFSEILGYICGDGHISISAHSVYSAVTDKDMENLEYYNRIGKTFKLNPKIKCRERKRLFFNSKFFTLYLKEQFPELISKSNKRTIPCLITKANDNVIKGFIRGLFDAEGHIGHHNLIIDNTSEKLLKQTQMLLNRLGITCYIDTYMMPERHIGEHIIKETRLFRLKIGSLEGIKAFYKIIGVTRTDKKQKIEDIIKRITKNRNAINVKFNDFLSLERIKSIECIKTKNEEVFDLGMKDNHNYFANGILAHNSIDNKTLETFLSHTRDVITSFQNISLTVIVCDCKIQAIHEFNNANIEDIKKIKLKGHGGTSFQEPIAWLAKNKPDVKLLIYLTDGECFEKVNLGKYNGRVLWVLTKDGTDQYIKNTGNIIKMED